MRTWRRVLACVLSLTMLSGLCMAGAAEAPAAPLSELKVGEKAERGMYTVQREEHDIWHVEDYTEANPRGIAIDEDGNMVGMNNCSDMYVVLGEDKAMLVDLSNPYPDNYADIQGIFDELAGDREKLIWITHCHYDHTGQFGAFSDSEAAIYITAEDVPNLSPDMQARVTAFDVSKDTIDLGGRTFKCVLVPSHTPGSNVLYETATKIGFSGDALGSGNGMWMFGGFAEYETGLQNLLNVIDTELGGEVKLYGGHTWQQTGTGEYIEMDRQYVADMLTLVENVKTGGEYSSEPYPYNPTLDTNIRYGKSIITVSKATVVTWGLANGLVINPFTDVTDEATVAALADLYAKGIVKGVSYDTFAPDKALTRAEFVTLIARAMGASVNNAAETGFTDVPANSWETGAVAWAVEKGLIEGYGDGRFGPKDPLTQEQVNTIVGRYVAKFGNITLQGFAEPDGVATRAAVLPVISAISVPPSMVLLGRTQVKDLDMRAFAAWGEYLDEDDYVSSSATYDSNAPLDLFDEHTFTNPEADADERTKEIKYFVYDPIAHGADPDGVYPVIYWFHGAGNAADTGMTSTCVAYAGASTFATPEYQEKMGPAYIVCPLANETKPNGQNADTWMTVTPDGKTSIYSQVLADLMDSFMKEHEGNVGKLVISGTSAGGYMAWRYIVDHTETVSGALLMAPAYNLNDEDLAKIDEADIPVWQVCGIHDELVRYDSYVKPFEDKLNAMDNFDLCVLDWVRHGDHSIATLHFGIEMGQHCICSQVGADLMFDDGTPMVESHPDGVTGWFRTVFEG